MLDKLILGTTYSEVVCEINVNEWTIYTKEGALKQKHMSNKVMYWSVDEHVTTASSRNNSSVFANEVFAATL